MSAPPELVSLIELGGKYKIRKELCEGANAYAFAAVHVHLGTDVFLKVYEIDPSDPGIFDEPRLLVDATREPGCSNLVEVKDTDRLGIEHALLAMAYVEGGSILHRIENHAISQAKAVDLAIGILCGVAHLHSCSIVHRDLKPSNILLAGGPRSFMPKITDFGSATRLADQDGTVRASRHSALYVPPEGWDEPSVFSRRSDLYQVGIVLHEMLSGPLPYNPESYFDQTARSEIRDNGARNFEELTDAWIRTQISNDALARAASRGKLLSFRPFRPYVSVRLRKVIRKATAPKPNSRFQSASDFMGALQRLTLPDWEPSPNSTAFSAASWRSWDWRVEASSDVAWISRARPGSGQFRRWRHAPDLESAARIVEDFR